MWCGDEHGIDIGPDLAIVGSGEFCVEDFLCRVGLFDIYIDRGSDFDCALERIEDCLVIRAHDAAADDAKAKQLNLPT